MGKMKWIYGMIQDGSYVTFKTMYKVAKKNNSYSFIWEGRPYSVILAETVVKLGDKAEFEYDKHIDDLAESQAEWLAEVARGR